MIQFHSRANVLSACVTWLIDMCDMTHWHEWHVSLTCMTWLIKVGLGIARTNADSQWNPVYNALNRIFCYGNETIRRWFCKHDLDAANLWPALEQGCGKQTPSARKLFFICYMFLMPKYKGDWDQVCALFRKENRCAMATYKKNVFRPQKKSELGIAQRFSILKYPNSAQT